MKFSETELHPDLLKAVGEAGFEELTEIQEKCLIPALGGQDIAGISQTGTGKTVAFLLPILNKLFNESNTSISALIVTPTRELCLQIADEVGMLTKFHPVKVCSIYGGEGYARQEKELLEGPDIIVATAGRLIDYLKQNKISLDGLKFLVLDEADRMFDMGFIRDIRFIMRKAPENVQTMLFSATLSYYVMRLASEYMHEPVEVRIESDTVAVEKIKQSLYHLGRNEKIPYLLNVLLSDDVTKSIIFTNLKTMVPVIVSHLRKYGIHATGLSSLLDQKKRIKLLKEFKLGYYKVLVATDVASRGLDVDDITHVFNFDLPQDSESYVHRIGRTARAGREGISISFCSETDYDSLPKIERYLGNKIPVEPINSDYLVMPNRSLYTPFVDEHDKNDVAVSERRNQGSRPPRNRRPDGDTQDRPNSGRRPARPHRSNRPRTAEKGESSQRPARRPAPARSSSRCCRNDRQTG